MRVLFKNTRYFFREIKTIIKLDLVSNVFSIISLAFIFFILSSIISGGWITNNMIEAIEKEAEISVYYNEGANPSTIAYKIREIEGVREVVLIDETQAKSKMSEIMGNESGIIELFDHNPFSPYIEVKIDLETIDTITSDVKGIANVELVRDNKEVLDKLKGISNLANIIGLIVIVAVSIATLVITSHIIRQCIYVNREQINTLKLLGAPEFFINLPFVLGGLLMTVLAGVLSVLMVSGVLKYIYSQIVGSLPFIILPNISEMLMGIGIFSLILSLILGMLGSFLGLRSTRA